MLQLKARLRDLLDVAPEDFRVRTYPAISWLARSEWAKADPDLSVHQGILEQIEVQELLAIHVRYAAF